MNPLVSIIIPVYNGSNYMREAIDSALAQTYDNVEVIVVNDGSSDDGKTAEIAKSYRDNIKYVEKENGGVASALNRGIEEMQGDFFSWLSHDDVYEPDKLKTQINYLQRHGANDHIMFSDFTLVDGSGKKIVDVMNSRPGDRQSFRHWITVNSGLNGCTLLIPRSAFAERKFNQTLKYTQDYDLWFDLAQTFKFVHQPELLVLSRQHPGQDTRKAKNLYSEINDLKTRFINELKREEITLQGSISYFTGCWEIFRNMRKADLHKAAWQAIRRYFRN